MFSHLFKGFLIQFVDVNNIDFKQFLCFVSINICENRILMNETYVFNIFCLQKEIANILMSVVFNNEVTCIQFMEFIQNKMENFNIALEINVIPYNVTEEISTLQVILTDTTKL